MTALLDDDLVAVDHQPMGFEPTDRAGFVRGWMGGLVEQMPDAVSVVAEIGARGAAVSGRIVTRGHTVDGSDYEWDSLFVARVGPDARIEFFPRDRRADALALLDEWAAREVPSSPPPDPFAGSRAIAMSDRFLELVRSGRERELTGLITDDYTYVDRRFGGVAPAGEGVAADEQFRAYGQVGMRFTSYEIVAVRGDGLGLIRQHLTSETGDEIVFLNLSELDGTDRMTRTEIFDESDLVAAIARLDEWYEATGAPRIESCVLGAYRSLNRRDWPAFEDHLDAELSVVDHRRLGFPPGRGGASLSRELQMLVAQVPDVVAYPTRIESRGDVALVTTHQTGTAAAGGGASWDFLTVVALASRSGRIGVNEYFDVDDVAGARRRFEEVARELEASPAVDNRCVRVVDRAFARHRRGEDVTDVFGAVGDPAPGATVEHLATRGHAGARPVARRCRRRGGVGPRGLRDRRRRPRDRGRRLRRGRARRGDGIARCAPRRRRTGSARRRYGSLTGRVGAPSRNRGHTEWACRSSARVWAGPGRTR